jgi:hypothetical protein
VTREGLHIVSQRGALHQQGCGPVALGLQVGEQPEDQTGDQGGERDQRPKVGNAVGSPVAPLAPVVPVALVMMARPVRAVVVIAGRLPDRHPPVAGCLRSGVGEDPRLRSSTARTAGIRSGGWATVQVRRRLGVPAVPAYEWPTPRRPAQMATLQIPQRTDHRYLSGEPLG